MLSEGEIARRARSAGLGLNEVELAALVEDFRAREALMGLLVAWHARRVRDAAKPPHPRWEQAANVRRAGR